MEDRRHTEERAIRLGYQHVESVLDLHRIGLCVALCVPVAGEERGRRHVHAGVGALSREDRRDQQLEGVAMAQLAPRVRVELPQPTDDGERSLATNLEGVACHPGLSGAL